MSSSQSAPATHYDAVDDIDYSDIYAENAVQIEAGFERMVLVDGLPIAKEAQREKLFKVIRKKVRELASVDVSADPAAMHMPSDAEGSSKGYLFLELKTPEQAAKVIRLCDGQPLDKRYTFRLNRFTDIETFANLSDDHRPPAPEPFEDKEHIRSWLTDRQTRDQIACFKGEQVSMNWHGRTGQLEQIESRDKWTDFYVTWSPLGSYMTTIHQLGIMLFGGPSFTRLKRFYHPAVKMLDYSPQENYLITWSNEPIHLPANAPVGPQHFSADDEGNQFAVWDVRTGHLLRTFPYLNTPAEDGSGPRKLVWPSFKWSSDEKYVGRVVPGTQISIYELPGMELAGKKSIKVDGVVDFSWCPIGDKDIEAQAGAASGKKYVAPKENSLVYWVPEVSNQPARVTLMAFPSRVALRSKNLFNVSDAQFYWQSNGDYLCVKVDRHTKTKKTIYCNLEIFRMREKDYPVGTIEIKDTVLNFAWEPQGDRFALIASNDPNVLAPTPGSALRTSVSFYQLDVRKGDFRLLTTLEARTTNSLFWSPRGRQIVLATTGSVNRPEIDFYDTDFYADDRREGTVFTNNVEDFSGGVVCMKTGEHYGITNIDWDPSGRYVVTSSSIWKQSSEPGYVIWDLRGTELQRHLIDKLKQIVWRPRPKSLLSQEEQKKIRRKLKDFAKIYDEEDAAEENTVSAELVAHRQRLVSEWNAWRAKGRAAVAKERASKKLDKESDHQVEEIEEVIEEIIDETEEIL